MTSEMPISINWTGQNKTKVGLKPANVVEEERGWLSSE